MLPAGAHISHEERPADDDDGVIEHRWGVELDGEQIAGLTVNHLPGVGSTVDAVETATPWRRRGLATALIEAARELLGEVQHSEWLTGDGLAWAKAVGGCRHGRPQDWTTDLSDGTRILGPTYTAELSLEGSH